MPLTKKRQSTLLKKISACFNYTPILWYIREMKSTAARMAIFFSLLILSSALIAQEVRSGADAAAPEIAKYLETLDLPEAKLHTLTDAQTGGIIDLAAKLRINVFELIDCTCRYAVPNRVRISITGDAMRKVQATYDLGQERVLALLPVDKMTKLETGYSWEKGQTALDVFLESPHQAFIEIGTAVYDKRFGFARIEPRLFAEPYGITVKKFIFSAPLEKLDLYAPGKGAIYAKGVTRPKKWNLWIITRK